MGDGVVDRFLTENVNCFVVVEVAGARRIKIGRRMEFDVVDDDDGRREVKKGGKAEERKRRKTI